MDYYHLGNHLQLSVVPMTPNHPTSLNMQGALKKKKNKKLSHTINDSA